MQILVVEDEISVATFIAKGLREHDYTVEVAHDGLSGFDLITAGSYDLVILDVALPGLNGVELCLKIRAFRRDLPIMMLSAMDSLKNKVQGLEAGADDYLTKPFHFEELLARMKAISRRRELMASATILRADDLEVDTARKIVTRNGRDIVLSVKEFTLLETLLLNKNKVLSRIFIAEQVWGITFDRGTNLIDVYINYLRSKIDKGHRRQLITTVIGMGYVIKDDQP